MSCWSLDEPFGLITRADLRRCIDDGQLQLHYQPVVDLVGGAVSAVEAVLRWQGPHLGWVQPEEFLALVEASGLTNHLGFWVLDTASVQMARWRAGGAQWGLSVATSLDQLQYPPYRNGLQRMFHEGLLDPRQLTLVSSPAELADGASGERSNELKGLLTERTKGSTLYTQAIINAVFTGELMDMPAGAVGTAIGFEYRNYAIVDQPDELSRNGRVWGASSAQVARGRDRVLEAFTEVEVPVAKVLPWIESLTVNGSGRMFSYNSVGSSDNVWKMGLNWQLNSALRVRASLGTSYRAPGLYELFLGNQSGFAPQRQVDPCIRWGEGTNDLLRTNCAARGIPADFTGASSSATVYSGGGVGSLSPERSRSKSVGVVLTPTFADMNIAIDYFDYEIRDEIAQLNAGTIVASCYASPVYPNRFCDQFTRGPATQDANSHAITEVHSRYLNINRQRKRGYDLSINASRDFAIGKFALETQATYALADVQQLFDSSDASGLRNADLLGAIGRAKLTATSMLSFKRGDWTARWISESIGATENLDLSPRFTYLGNQNATRDIRMESRLYHAASLTYDQSDWRLTVGVRNIFNRTPPSVSQGVATSYANFPIFATQYDILGRAGFVDVTYRF
ncbi:UNVERIFIED_ORG: hypothetical protein ABIC77_002941 [Stenotrophomonas geniculata]